MRTQRVEKSHKADSFKFFEKVKPQILPAPRRLGVSATSRRGIERKVRCGNCGTFFGFTSGKTDAIPVLDLCGKCKD